MEQESERTLLSNTIKRVGYMMVLATHAIFIGSATIGAIFLLVILLS